MTSDLVHNSAAEQALSPPAVKMLRADPPLRQRWHTINKVLSSVSAGGDLAHPMTTRARQNLEDAGDFIARITHNAREAGLTPDRTELVEAEAARTRARQALDEAHVRATALVSAMAGTRDAVAASAVLLNHTAAAGEKFKHIEVNGLKGHPTDVVTAQQGIILGLLKERGGVVAAPPGPATVLAQLVAELDGDAALPSFSITAKGAQLRWPQAIVMAEPRPGYFPTTTDAGALLAALHRDAIIEHLRGEVDRKYVNVPLALDADARAERLAAIDADIVAAERIEVAAIIAANDLGIPTGFRKATTPRALLGVA